MNFFFGVNNHLFKSEIQIPLFRNREFQETELKLFKCFPQNNKWILKEIENRRYNKYFYILKNEDIQNNEIYFLASKNIYEEFDFKKLKNFNNFTDTNPAYRANFTINLIDGGYSSYQSEYPYHMTTKNGSISSSVSSLTNNEADNNYIIIKNIFHEPIEETYLAYLIDYKKKKIEKKFELKSNHTCLIELDKNLIRPEIYLFTKKYLGIPLFVSVKDKNLSFEHTHPPHTYIVSHDKFNKVSKFKKDLNEIIN